MIGETNAWQAQGYENKKIPRVLTTEIEFGSLKLSGI
jgi:hypothetical protein